jgi:two-component system, chemotaxis family, response regulator PixG
MTVAVEPKQHASIFIARLVQQAKKQLTGQLDIQAANGERWSIYFCVGRILWATHHDRNVRALRYHLLGACPELDFKSLIVREADKFFSWDYQVLWVLEKRKTISMEQTGSAIKETIVDCMFDILRHEQQGALQFKLLKHEALNMLRMQLVALNVVALIKKAQAMLQEWNEAKLAGIDPDAIPSIADRDALQANIPSKVFQQLTKRIDGRTSLRELSLMMKIDLVRLSRSLLAYIRKGWISVVPAPDIPRPQPPTTDTSAIPCAEDRRQSLIACIDDSPQVCELMKQIITEAGYRFIGVTDSVRALPVLLEKHPSMIFLDLVMPVANGYEVCTQLRRMSVFETTPIVILTGNDGVVDRVRAKMVKASDFLSKPVDKSKVLSAIERLLQGSETPVL